MTGLVWKPLLLAFRTVEKGPQLWHTQLIVYTCRACCILLCAECGTLSCACEGTTYLSNIAKIFECSSSLKLLAILLYSTIRMGKFPPEVFFCSCELVIENVVVWSPFCNCLYASCDRLMWIECKSRVCAVRRGPFHFARGRYILFLRNSKDVW